MGIEGKIKKGDRVQFRLGRKPKGKVVGTAWGYVLDRNGKQVGRELWVRIRWEDRNYGGLNPDAVVAKDVRLLAAAKGGGNEDADAEGPGEAYEELDGQPR